MQDIGFHYRITDIQIALALSQLKKINKFLDKRKKLLKFMTMPLKNRAYNNRTT